MSEDVALAFLGVIGLVSVILLLLYLSMDQH